MASKSSQSDAGVPAGRFIVNSRCFVGAYRKTYDSVVKPHHNPAIARTVFGNILLFPDITSDRPMLEYILRHWKGGVEYEIGPEVIRFTTQEVAVLLGLPLSGSPIDLTRKLNSDIQRRYLEGKKVDRKNLEVVLKELSPKQDEEDITDFVKLLILYFFSCILFTNTNNLCPKGLVGIVDDLPGLARYNWPDAVHRFIHDSLCSAAAKLQAKSKRVGYVIGCTPLLPVWIYEHTGYRSPLPSRRPIYPRIQRWDTIRWSRRSRGSPKVKEDFNFTSCRRRLEPSPDEQRLLGVVDEEVTAREVSGHLKSPSVPVSREVQAAHFAIPPGGLFAGMSIFICDELHNIFIHMCEDVEPLIAIPAASVVADETEDSAIAESTHMKTTGVSHRPPSIIEIPPSEATSIIPRAKKLKLEGGKTSAPVDLNYYGKGVLPFEDQERIEKFLTNTNTESITVPSKQIHIPRNDFVDLTRYKAFVSSDIIDSYQHLLEEAEGQRCIYSTSYLSQAIGTSINPDMFLGAIKERVLTEARYWFIPLFDFDHWHLLAVDLDGGNYLHLSSIINPKYNAGFDNACKFVGEFLNKKFPEFCSRRGTRPNEWEKHNLHDIPTQDQSNDCAIFLLTYEEYLQRGLKFDFSQKDITRKRGEIAAEFLRHYPEPDH